LWPLSAAGVRTARVASVPFVEATGWGPTRGMLVNKAKDMGDGTGFDSGPLVNKAKDMGDGTGFDSGPYEMSDDRPTKCPTIGRFVK
jgi:hypothetical protein